LGLVTVFKAEKEIVLDLIFFILYKYKPKPKKWFDNFNRKSDIKKLKINKERQQ